MTSTFAAEAVEAAGLLLPASDRPIIRSIQAQNNEASIELTIPDTLAVLQGHFPGTPVVPGILQIDWACKLAPHFFKGLGEFKQMTQVKFKTMILPEAKPTLTLSFNEKKSTVKFHYSDQAQSFSTGVLNFSPC